MSFSKWYESTTSHMTTIFIHEPENRMLNVAKKVLEISCIGNVDFIKFDQFSDKICEKNAFSGRPAYGRMLTPH